MSATAHTTPAATSDLVSSGPTLAYPPQSRLPADLLALVTDPADLAVAMLEARRDHKLAMRGESEAT